MVTAIIDVLNQQQQPRQCRTLIDTCSTSNFITEGMAESLGLTRKECQIPVGALNTLSTVSRSTVAATIRSRHNGYHRTLTCLTIPTISQLVPDQLIQRGAIKIPKNIKLADPEFYRPAPVDMLLGSGTALALLCVGQLDLSPPTGPDLYLQKTQLGWVIGGSAPSAQLPQSKTCHVSSELQFDLSKFWEIEEGHPTRQFTKEEALCEEHFLKHVKRNLSGRYSVALPFNSNFTKLGNSKALAFKRLKSIERKLALNQELRTSYNAVLQEYLDLDHMTPVREDRSSEAGFYLPHHAVIKESSSTTAVRVVFDGSAKSSTGISLNDTLSVGPTIQSDLFSLLLRFRKHSYVITGDIEKMYRQFLVRPADRKYQRILWRNANGEEQTYELNTITFGLTSAPYLAIRCLHQLAEDEQRDFPQAARVLKEDFYVDDALTGGDTIEEVRKIREQLTKLLERGRLNIRQWASNAPALLEGLSTESINRQVILEDSPTIKTLGVRWHSNTDTIVYTVKPLSELLTVTKRIILSETARIFDPLGLLAPVITMAKIFMQRLWTLKLDWDESLPTSLHTEWMTYHQQLQSLNNLSFQRKVIINQPTSIELHGFCDASERAYGACIYLRSMNSKGRIHSSLLCAKSRVTPVKTVTIPRLELCGALLLAHLMSDVNEALRINFNQIIYWTDSTIVLHWLQTSPQSLKTFVANRVAEIQSKTNVNNWRHVRTHDNPADLVSRGQLPEEFMQPSLWSQGPPWLSESEATWPDSNLTPIAKETMELKKVSCLKTQQLDLSLLTRYSSIQRLTTIIAYCMRFKLENRNKGELTVAESHSALQIILRLVQSNSFFEEITCIQSKKPINRNSRILPLNPFIDKNGLLRVGGRLKHSLMPFTQRHPVILPKSHHVTHLLIEFEHRIHLHAGVQATLYALRRKYWLIDGRNEVRKILRNCVICCKLSPPTIDYLMGDLPSARVTQSRPFSRVGIDYCGPFFIKEKKHRNRNKIKVYVAVFVCLAVKAVHLELVSDLSTDAFLASFRRFIARRGICSDIYSDNGTNFIGAHNELKDLHTLLTSVTHQQKVNNFAIHHSIKWHFIPARAPNFGGLWEAAVKSFKHHLRRVVGNALFTYEDLNTVTIEIEAILNSRPLTPLSSDPNDLLVLTPGHFLIGDSLTSLPERELRDVPTNRLSSWQHIQQVRQHFWSRWSREYLNELTIRHKWTKEQPTIQKGAIVLLKEDNLPPLQWVMGRVTKLHTGPDGITRVVTVKTARSTFDRSVKKVAPLPVLQTNEHSVSVPEKTS